MWIWTWLKARFKRSERATPDEWERRAALRVEEERRILDEALRDFARRYHSSPPYSAVGAAVPKGMTLRGFTTEALKRYPNLEACR